MRPKVGLVLGGGGSRGSAHIGVLQVLVRENIPIDLLVGTSMGGIVGTLFALGISPDDLATRFVANMEGSNLLNMNVFSARSRQKAVRTQLWNALHDKTFADLNLPVTLMAVDMQQGEEVLLREGPLMPAVLASAAVPAIFPPVEHMGMQLADGGVIDSLATHVAYEMGADKIIAVDVYPPLEQDKIWADPLNAIAGIGLTLPGTLPILPEAWTKTPSMAAAMWRAFRIMTWHLHEKRLAEYPPDILLRPGVERYGSMDFKDICGPISAGIAEAEAHLPAIRRMLGLSAVA